VISFKKLVFFFLFLFISMSLAQISKTNIAVIDLDPTAIPKNEAQFLSDRLRTELFETGVFQVVEREKMTAILNEQGFQQTGCTSVECAIAIYLGYHF
jgi:curli biogenesis system outer membrane secretion channel CsgG